MCRLETAECRLRIRLAFVLICAQLSTLGAGNVIIHSSEAGSRGGLRDDILHNHKTWQKAKLTKGKKQFVKLQIFELGIRDELRRRRLDKKQEGRERMG